MQQFRGAQSEVTKHRIAQRLENDRQSASARVRYYAVKAMAQLDSPEFRGAVLAATLDEDTAVRNVAKDALRT